MFYYFRPHQMDRIVFTETENTRRNHPSKTVTRFYCLSIFDFTSKFIFIF